MIKRASERKKKKKFHPGYLNLIKYHMEAGKITMLAMWRAKKKSTGEIAETLQAGRRKSGRRRKI